MDVATDTRVRERQRDARLAQPSFRNIRPCRLHNDFLLSNRNATLSRMSLRRHYCSMLLVCSRTSKGTSTGTVWAQSYGPGVGYGLQTVTYEYVPAICMWV